MTKRIKITKWGNSLGLRLPSHIVTLLKLKAGSEVEVFEKNGIVQIRNTRKKYDIDELVGGITEDNIHEES